MLGAALGLALAASGCAGGATSSGSFERSLSVTGPVRLELANGSGSVQISAGDPGQVRIRGEVRIRAWPWDSAQRRLAEFTSHPPIEQRGNIIRIGYEREAMRRVKVSYTISVPAETDVQATVGSGAVSVRDIHGPAKLTTGSGGISAENIREDVQATTGSGGIALSRVQGQVRATTGSGGIALSEISGEIRAMTGSGGIAITEPGGRITAKTGSGGITVNGAAADLRAATGSGKVTVEGNPAVDSMWDLRTASGGVDIAVPSNASFRLYARVASGHIETNIPITIEEQTKRELRGRVGTGAARLEVRSGSGNIHIR